MKRRKSRKPAASVGREAAGVFLLGLAVLVLAALVSFHPLDPAPGQSVGLNAPVKNWIGLFGAYLAGFLVALLGLAALWTPALLGWYGVRFFSKSFERPSLATAVGLALLIPATAGLIGLVWPKLTWHAEPLAAGGAVGAILAGALAQWLKTFGAVLVLLATAVIGLMLAADFSLAALIEAARTRGGSFFGRLATAKIRIREKRRKAASPRMKRLKEQLEEAPERIEISFPPPPPLPKPRQEQFEFMAQMGDYQTPPLSLLDAAAQDYRPPDAKSLERSSQLLEKKLFDFGVEGQVQAVHPGPVITMYEFAPAPGVKIAKIANLADDLALALRASAIRIVAPLPGKGCIGIEIPHPRRETVALKELLAGEAYQDMKGGLPLVLGKDIVGQPVITDLTAMPHLLIAGATGSGKSVCLNAMLMSILFKAAPEDVRLLMIDPKRIELNMYDGMPHLLHPVLTDPKSATKALRWAVYEMERRYDILARANVRSIESFNRKRPKMPKSVVEAGEDREALPERLPYIVIIIDELADLMMVSSRDVEESITRLAQMARAAGIHLVLATQRPSVDVLTGVIKANFPTRIAFQVASKIDSRTILDQNGAENLLGRGDMLFMPPGVAKLMRVHGAFVSDAEVKRVTDFLRSQGRPEYETDIMEIGRTAKVKGAVEEEVDELYREAVAIVLESGKASISMVQRKLRVGYNRAARMIEQMAIDGLVSEPDHTNQRQVLARPGDLPEV